MADNSQQFGFRESNPTRRVNEVEVSSIQQQLSELTSFVRQLAVGNVHQAKVCGFCTNVGHPTDSCPMLQEDGAEQVNMAGGVPAPRRQYDPYSNTYNLGWGDHPNFSYGNRPQNSFSNRPPGFQQPWQQKPQPSSSNSGSSLEDIVKSMATSTAQFQQETRSGMKDMEIQMSQMTTAINRLESHVYGKLPSQPEANPRNVSTMTLRSGKEVEGSKLTISKSKREKEIEKGIEEEGRICEEPKVASIPSIPIKSNLAPFPCRFEKTKRAEKAKEILDVFRKIQVNIPLLDVIKQVPKYAKFLKDLCVNKRKLRGDEKVMVGENVSVVLQRKLPPKCGDPGMFTIPCKIGHSSIKNAMIDLGASINVMPKSIYDSLNLGPLKEMGIIIQLADRTCIYPDGIVEDVLVQVDGLIFPTDFYVLYMDDRSTSNPSPIILGMPFLSTAQTKIDVSKGTLTMEFDGEIVHFNIFDTIKHHANSHSVFAIHATNPSVQEFSEFVCRGKFKIATNKYHGMEAIHEVKMGRKFRKNVAFNGYLDPGGEPRIRRKIELHPD
ncbi:uncharacterized protein [Coffea arabica]|uniref:Retrotransposon gag protein n=1 Tax=Coffea arabica TaxID=13443 RepID=A0ABM4UE79_COFAR